MEYLSSQLDDFVQKISNTDNIVDINNLTEELVKSVLDCEFSSIWYYDESQFALIRNRNIENEKKIHLSHKKGIMYKCFMTKQSELYNYLASDKDYVASIDNPDNIKIKSKVMIPLLYDDNLVGIVTAYNSIRYHKKFMKKDVEKLKYLSSYIIKAICKMYKKSIMVQDDSSKVMDTNNEKETNTDDILTFVANFVHDIRTPSNSLYGFLELLEEQIKDERLKTYIINAKESANFINELTTSVLDMVSTHKESIISEIKEIESVKFFSSIAKSFASNMSKKDIDFNIYIDPMLPKTIKIDTLKIKRVILNLIGNAYKFTPSKKSIEFSLKYVKKTNRMVLYVKDTGIGIPKDKQKTIFEAFKQAEDTTALNFGGSGLGLFISAKYVKELGGNLSLVSEVDKGSTFSFDMPVDIVDSKPSYKPIEHIDSHVAIIMDAKNNFCANNVARYLSRMGVDKENILAINSFDEIDENISYIIVFQNKIDQDILKRYAKKGAKILIIEEEFLILKKEDFDFECDIVSQYNFIGNKIYRFLSVKKPPKILIVDDDSISIKLMEMILEDEFCDINVAKDGKEALDKIIKAYENKEAFDIVYIDNKMPIMSGGEVVKHIREYEKNNDVKPIFAISTSGEVGDFSQDEKLYDFYLGKPFKKEQVKQTLKLQTNERKSV